MRVLSLDEEIARLPPGHTATPATESEWPTSVRNVGDAILRLKFRAIARADILKQLLESLCVRVTGKIAIVSWLQMKWNIASSHSQNRDYALALMQGTKLFGAADFRDIRPLRKQRQDDLGVVDPFLYFYSPTIAALDPPRIQPHIETEFRQAAPQPPRKLRSIPARVRDEYAEANLLD